MAQTSTLDRQTVLGLLNTHGTSGLDEDFHPWRVQNSQSSIRESFQKPLLRIWDCKSGSQPVDGIGMLSRAPDMRLDSAEVRKTTLGDHLDYRRWVPGPYISFTISPEAIEALGSMRAKRGPHTLTVVDPNTRVENGLPVLDVAAEMDCYDIPDPYGRSKEYYINHYVCLWQVTEAEIIGHWDWSDLSSNPNWYQDTIIPAFRQHNSNDQIAPAISESHDIDGLSTVFGNLTVALDPPEYSDSDISGELFNSNQDDEDDWDTDDEVEEANAADDMIKIIEGD